MSDLLEKITILRNPGQVTATARIQKTGRLGFSLDGIKLMGIDESKFIRIGQIDDENDKESLFLIIDDVKTDDGFDILKVGDYYNLATADFFSDLGYNYENDKYSYRIKRTDDPKIFKLAKYVSRYKKRDKTKKTVS